MSKIINLKELTKEKKIGNMEVNIQIIRIKCGSKMSSQLVRGFSSHILTVAMQHSVTQRNVGQYNVF